MIFDAIIGIFILAGIFFFLGYAWRDFNLKITVKNKCNNTKSNGKEHVERAKRMNEREEKK